MKDDRKHIKIPQQLAVNTLDLTFHISAFLTLSCFSHFHTSHILHICHIFLISPFRKRLFKGLYVP